MVAILRNTTTTTNNNTAPFVPHPFSSVEVIALDNKNNNDKKKKSSVMTTCKSNVAVVVVVDDDNDINSIPNSPHNNNYTLRNNHNHNNKNHNNHNHNNHNHKNHNHKMVVVSFANPIVTQSWIIERIPQDWKPTMYYSGKDILRFKLERKLELSSANHSSSSSLDHQTLQQQQQQEQQCDWIIERLDRAGIRHFRHGNYVRALNAFVTALRLRTGANIIELDPKAISNNIHCIGDIYNKQKDYANALNAYQGSLDAIQARTEDKQDKDVLRTIISLKRKMALVKIQLGAAKVLHLKL